MEPKEKTIEQSDNSDDDFTLDFTTSSAISKISLKFLIIYIPIFWFSGLLISAICYQYTWFAINVDSLWWIVQVAFLPLHVCLVVNHDSEPS